MIKEEIIFNKISKYGDITREEVSGFLTYFKIENLDIGDLFYKPDDNKSVIALQFDGLIRSYIISDNGDERTIDFCRSGDIISTIEGESPSSSWIEAIKPTTIGSINAYEFEEIVSKDKKLQIILLKMMEACLTLKSKRERELLSLDGKDRYLKFIEDYKEILNDIPQYQIASYLGISPVSLSRIKKNLN